MGLLNNKSHTIIESANYGSFIKCRPTKGRLAWEYNPFLNYRLNLNRFKVRYDTGKKDKYNLSVYASKWYYSLDELNAYTNINSEFILNGDFSSGALDLTTLNYSVEGLKIISLEVYQKNLLTDLDTDEFEFDVDNPVEVLPQPSYDGSVNLILNDGVNKPRIINSRFSNTGLNTYEIVDRKGENDTNIYDEGELFDIDTSLYKRVNQIQTIEFLGTPMGGNLQVGNYHFYFKLADADGNETDFIGLSGLVSVFIGSGNPSSTHTGTENENSCKMVKFKVSNIDKAYSYLHVYYSRASAATYQHRYIEYKRINKQYIVNSSGSCNVVITGYETAITIPASDLNLSYNIVDAAKALALNGNILFLGNVHKADIPYKELTDISLRFYPELNVEDYKLKINQKYTISSKDKGYYDVKNIYNKVGYWPNEYYRFGIVYILNSGELSPVFNIRGGLNIGTTSKFLDLKWAELDPDSGVVVRKYIIGDEETYLIDSPESYIGASDDKVDSENVKGVCQFKVGNSLNCIINPKISYLDIKAENNGVSLIEEIRKYAKGFFFVRLKRIPTILAQGVTIGIENESHTPVIPVVGGVVDQALKDASHGHITFSTLYPNYVTEGFLTHYQFEFKKKKSGWWSKVKKAVLIGTAVTALAAAAVLSGGLAAVAAGATFAMSTVGTVAVAGAIATAAAVVTTATVAGIQRLGLSIRQLGSDGVYNGWQSETRGGYYQAETDESRKVGGAFKNRLIIKEPGLVSVQGIICPEFSVNQAYYNNFLTGNEHLIREVNSQTENAYFSNNRDRNFYINSYTSHSEVLEWNAKVMGVPDNTKIVGIDDLKFRSRAGEAEEAYKFEDVGNEYQSAETITTGEDDDETINNRLINSDIIRGAFGPYLALSEAVDPVRIVEIYVSGFSDSLAQLYLQIRAEDTSPFYAISQRIDITRDAVNSSEYLNRSSDVATYYNVYSGDSYICQVSHRLIRNFNDPSSLYNDIIVDEDTWKDNYDPENSEKFADINRGDLNAVLLGMWVTFTVRSTDNLNIRTLDTSNIDENAMSGHARAYYPIHPLDAEGSYKIPDSSLYNDGFEKSVSEQVHFEQNDVPWIKNWFGTRIMYSDIHVNDAFKNGYRVFRPTRYRDYTREYGEIVKLISQGEDLIAIMEHGILQLKVNAKAVNTPEDLTVNNVLPENPIVISPDYGSLWKDSVILTPAGIYGVDTVARKIWLYTKGLLQLISELKVLEFLNRNINLTEKQLSPVLGRTNVKSFYNKFKRDVTFSFYNPTLDGYDELAWHLCYNEDMLLFVTFYSWIPSFMENIDNIPFSFDRDISKNLSILNQTNYLITLSDPVYDPHRIQSKRERIWKYTNGEVSDKSDIEGYFTNNIFNLLTGELGILTLDSAYNTNDNVVNFSLVEDREGNYKFFDISTSEREWSADFYSRNRWSRLGNSQAILKFKEFSGDYPKGFPTYTDDNYGLVRIEVRADVEGGQSYILTMYVASYQAFQRWSTDFWKHGLAGIIDILDKIKPTFWYGQQHPFEYEFIVNDDSVTHKIFDNLEIISNNVAPDSFHYEIVGDVYNFAWNKPRMYVRQEETRKLFFEHGANISYDMNYSDVIRDYQDVIVYKDPAKEVDLSTIFPANYGKQDKLNSIADIYWMLTDPRSKPEYDTRQIGGAEVTYYDTLSEFRIVNHVKSVDMSEGRIRGNTQYKEDRFDIQINPIFIAQKNENLDGLLTASPPTIVVNPYTLPNDVITYVSNNTNGQLTSTDGLVVIQDDWVYKEVKPKDKWIKIKVRYTGSLLAIIQAIRTFYSISYS